MLIPWFTPSNLFKIYLKAAKNMMFVCFRKMMEYIFKNMMVDASNSNYVCKYLYVMFRHTEKGSTLRTLFYRYLEKYYKGKFFFH